MKYNFKKIAIFLASVFTFSVLALPTQQARAITDSSMTIAENQGLVATNVKYSENDTSFTLVAKDQDLTIDMSISKIDEDNIEVLTTTSEGESHRLTYNRNDDYMVMDGEEITVVKTVTYNENLAESTIQRLSSSSYDPIYVSTNKLNVSRTVTTIGAIATLIGGVIAIAALTGVSIATSVIASKIANWASVVGLASLAAGYLFDGYVQYDLYKTKEPVSIGYGSNQIAYRYEDVRAIGEVRNKYMNVQLLSQGSWCFGTKPF
ncbi:hypothetical protein [Clostridium faecium]|uniref:Uncharacterized protein n=1 Tax=Clostridium faecium TaxID=2762223 RepID=A0ABR8YPQ6_9CLOT|nr:hypothetical protein [Clostridium faecium]MBD8046204.1 hypothetical protein [Clostridium faecium]MDU1351096.1 hypothetical protein [Clostridium argentinense]